MREFGKLEPTFWTRGSGKALRGHPEAQIVAAYLFSCGSSNLIGIYYLPIPTLAHETGLGIEGASKALRRVCEEGIAAYDEESELVWVPGLAKRSVGSELKPADKRVKGIERELEQAGEHPFVRLFLERYATPFSLSFALHIHPSKGMTERPATPSKPLPDSTSAQEAPSKPLPVFDSNSEAPSETLRSQSRAEQRKSREESESGAAPPATHCATNVGSGSTGDAVRVELGKFRCFDVLPGSAAATVASIQLARIMSLAGVLEAIRECGEKSEGLGLNAEAMLGKLVGFVKRWRPSRGQQEPIESNDPSGLVGIELFNHKRQMAEKAKVEK
jgi:hypothetical protein